MHECTQLLKLLIWFVRKYKFSFFIFKKKAIIYKNRFFMRKFAHLFFLFVFLWSTQVGNANFEYKISDAIAPFFDQYKPIKHYSSIPFYQLDISSPPYVDEFQFEEIKINFWKYIKNIKEAQYTHISLDDINHLILWEKYQVYQNSYKLQRHKRYRELYHFLIGEAKKEHIWVFLTSDIQFYTQEIEEKFSLEKPNENLTQFDRSVFDEILTEFPEIDGVILRVGEGGKAYNTSQYKSKILFKAPEELNSFLKSILPIFETKKKKLILRTWTIWAWNIGDLVINPETYEKVFKDIRSESMIASIKITPWDFFDFPDFNPTIWVWNIPQIVEIQVRREYEWWGDFPNYMGQEYIKDIQFLQNKKNVIWVWNWNQTGGWGWGHNIIFNFWFNLWNEINFWSISEILLWENDPEVSLRHALEKIAKKYQLNDHQTFVLERILLYSHETLKKYWYVPRFKENTFTFLGIRIPPLLYIWWDRPTSSPLILSLISNIALKDYSNDSPDATLSRDIDTWSKFSTPSGISRQIGESLLNRKKIFLILKSYKEDFILQYAQGQIQHKNEVLKEIQDYEKFISDKPYFHFDFTEVKDFYLKKNTPISTLILCFFFFLSASSLILVLIRQIKRDSINLSLKNRPLVYLLLWIFIELLLVYVPAWYRGGYIFLRFLDSLLLNNTLVFFWYFFLISNIVLFFLLEESFFYHYRPIFWRMRKSFLRCCVYIGILLGLFGTIGKPYLTKQVESLLPSYFQSAGSDISQIL